MAKKNVKLGTVKISDLELDKAYKVHYSTFGRKTGSRGAFISASFIIQLDENDENSKVWVNCPSEKSSYKVIGILTALEEKQTITYLKVVENNSYRDFIYTTEPYVPDEITDTTEPNVPDEISDLDDFETIG